MRVKAETAGDPVLRVKDVITPQHAGPVSPPAHGHKDLDQKPGHRMILLTILFSMVCKGTMVVILAPFFPAEATRKGLTPTSYGLVFAAFTFGQLLISPFSHSVVRILGPKSCCVLGTIIMAGSTTAFAFVSLLTGSQSFFWTCLALGLLCSTGGALLTTASFTLIFVFFSDRIPPCFALVELSFGMGMMIGPSVGAFLYESIGFPGPFLVFGILSFSASLSYHLTVPSPDADSPSDEKKDKKPPSVLTLLKNPGIAVNMGIACLSFVNTGFMDVTLAQHLVTQFGLGMRTIALLFFLTSGVYVLTNQLSGFVIHKWPKCTRPLILCGFFCSAVMFVLTGPMFPLTFEESMTSVVVRQVVFGLAIGPQMVGSFSDGSSEVFASGLPRDLDTTSAFSALYTTAMTLGACVGPSVGGAMVDHMGYKESATVMFSLQILMILTLVILMLLRRRRPSGVQDDTVPQVKVMNSCPEPQK